MSWRDSLVRPTPEYLGGICAGCGLGLMIGSYIWADGFPRSFALFALMVAVGGYVAGAAQRRQRHLHT